MRNNQNEQGFSRSDTTCAGSPHVDIPERLSADMSKHVHLEVLLSATPQVGEDS